MKKLLFVLMAVILISGLVFNGCTSESTATTTAKTTAAATTTVATPKSGGTFKYADPIGPRTSLGWMADPVGFLNGVYTNIFFDSLLESDNNGIIKPCLATKYEVSPDLKTITLTLRQGVKFHDGSDMNATVVKWNIDQIIGAKIGEYTSVTSVDVVDDYTVKLNVSKYTNTLLNFVASTFIISKAYYDSKGGGKDAIEAMRWYPVGTGPFKFVSYTPNVSIKGVKFTDYWQKGKPYLDAIEYYIIGDQMTRSQSLMAGEVDAIAGDLSKVEYDLQQKGYQIVKGYISTGGLVPDSKNADSPLSKLKVRQAIDCAIDRDALCKSLGYGFWAPTEQWAVPGSKTYISGIPANNYNIEKAKQLLTEAGYPDGFKITLYGSVATTSKDFATAVQGYLSKVGINMEVNLMDHAAYTDLSIKGWKNGFAAGAKAIDGNMNYALSLAWTQTSPYHPSMDKPDAFQKLYDTSAAAKDYDPMLVQKAIQYMYDNIMYIPVYWVSRGQVMQTYVHDTGFYTFHNWASWRPADTWFDK